MRTLTWDLNNPVVSATHKRRYVLNGRYEPIELRINAGTVSDDANLIVDVNDGGSSIFDVAPALSKNDSLKRHRTFANAEPIADGSVLTLDVDQGADGIDGVLVELDLVEV